MIYKFQNHEPKIGKNVFIAPSADVIGNVELGNDANIWHGAVLRADINQIIIGKRTNVQDNSVFHVTDDLPCILGNDVTVGHGVILHGCTIKDRVLIGMGAIVLDGAIIEEDSIIAAGAVVTPKTIIPKGSMVMGSPAKIKRELTLKEISFLMTSAKNYVDLARSQLDCSAN